MTDELLPHNRGRWGENDERGTLSLITEEVRARAAAEVRTVRWVSLAPPVHPHGMPLIDAADVADLAALCAELGRYSFLLIAAPPRVTGTVGLPVNPIAMF